MSALLLAAIPLAAISKDRLDTMVVNRIFNYRSVIDSTIEGYRTQAYLKFRVKTTRRNVALLCVPHLYHTVVRSNSKSHFGESYVTLTFHESKATETEVHARTSTLRRHRTVMPNMQVYLTPNLYHTTLLCDHLYSPFHIKNKRYYKYSVRQIFGSNANVEFRPRLKNTQAVRGNAIVDVETGRIIRCTIVGEFDMVAFEINLTMGEEGLASLLPTSCTLKTKFSFMGNQLRGIYEARYGSLPLPTDTLMEGIKVREMLDTLRPVALSLEEERIYAEYDSVRRSYTPDTTKVKEKNFMKDFLWDVIGDHLLNRIKGNFDNAHGYYRISPIINPLYLTYSHHRGLTYRITARAGYEFNENSNLNLRAKVGYSFKLNHTYFDLPLTYTYNDRKNGKVKLSWRNDELQTTSTVLDQLRKQHGNTFKWDTLDLDYFKHSRLALLAQYDINPFVGIETGILFNQWRSVDKKDFKAVGKPTLYKSTALCEELTLRPLGWHGPIVTINYERTLERATKERMNYEKWEFDCSYLKHLPCLRSLSLRAGVGFYTTSTKNTLFLDFNNFREDNIPGGWGDEWSGDFELLHSNWYNSSPYYVRANATYQSPLLLLSWIPLIGTITENERIYVSALHLSQIKYYMELGYSFTNRLLSMGIFTGYEEFKHFTLGLRFGFELFDRW